MLTPDLLLQVASKKRLNKPSTALAVISFCPDGTEIAIGLNGRSERDKLREQH
jgi:hypothetical protein